MDRTALVAFRGYLNGNQTDGHAQEHTHNDGACSEKAPLVFIIGDFNAIPDAAAYRCVTGNRYDPSKTNAKPSKDEQNTSESYIDLRREMSSDYATPTWAEYAHDEKQAIDPPMTLDHIFVADNGALNDNGWKGNDVVVVDNEFEHLDGKRYRYSDHRMLVAYLSLS